MRAPVSPHVLPRCLRWLEHHVEWFSPAVWNASFPPPEVPVQTVLELLLLCRVMQRGPAPEEARTLIDAATKTAHAQVLEPAFADSLGHPDPNFPYATWVLGLLPRDSAGTAPLRDGVQQQLNRHGRGLVPFDWPVTNQIELDYACTSGGFEVDLADFAELRGESAYAGRDPALVSEPEAYALTHELLYATDLGARPLPVGTAAVARVATLVDALLTQALADGQLDLTAELLHCTLVCGSQGDERLWSAGWAALESAQLDSGAVPGPLYQADVAAERPPEEADAYEFRACYHTTLVTAMAAAAAAG